MHREAELVLPDILFGGDLRGFLDFLGLRGRPLGKGRWSVWPNNDKTFISHHGLADDTEFVNRFDRLKNIPISSPYLDDPDTLKRLAEMDKQLAERMSGGSDITAHFYSIQASLMHCRTHEQLVKAVEQACAILSTSAFEEDDEQLFSGLSAHLVSATDLLIRRVRLPAILFRFDQDPDAMATIASLGDEGGYFASSTKWFHNVISASHYFGPLLGCLAPGFWCIPTERPPAAILFNLGNKIAGYRHTPMEPMQMLPAEGRDEPVPRVNPTPEACRVAITWWTNRLNGLFGCLCDPTLFTNAHGVYDPYEHQHWLLTFGQVFELITAVQTLGRNYAAQRALMNTLLDSYADRILDCDFEKLCRYDHARGTAERLRSKMPDTVATLLMPLADRAVESLRQVQDGFFFREQRGDKNVIVRIPGSDRGHHKEPPRAAAMLLKLYRNATHGFGGIRPPRNDEDLIAERLLAHHTGEMPDDLVFLPYLYLLDVLCHPEDLRKTIVKRARRRH